MDSVNPLDVLREEMENEEIGLRVNAVHRIRVVATLLPPDKMKSQLIPYIDCTNVKLLLELIKKEEDEVLFALAEELGNIA
jgi:serine/threonine-protein phosphatase 2A regulatory subunit A